MQVVHTDSSVARSRELPQSVRLEIRRGVTRCRVHQINKPLYVIGGADDCDLVLNDPQFADYHVYILQRDDHVTIRHMGAAPMVTVNQRWMRWGELVHGDRIRMGPYEFVVKICPRFVVDNPRKRENRTPLRNLTIFGGVSSINVVESTDVKNEPVSWSDGRSPHRLSFPCLSPWEHARPLDQCREWW